MVRISAQFRRNKRQLARGVGGVPISVRHPSSTTLKRGGTLVKYLDFSLDTCYGHVLSLWCATITLMISLDTCYGVGCELPVVKSACTRDSLFGLYTTGLSSLAVTGRLVSIEQGNCERNEGEFKVVKDALLSRSNFQLKHAFNMLRRHTLAKSITICTNTTACESSARVDTKLEDLRVSSSAALGIGPKPLDGRNGESRRFTEVQVRTATFVVAWLRWLPDYIVKRSWCWGDELLVER